MRRDIHDGGYFDPGAGDYGQPIWRVGAYWLTATGAQIIPSGRQYPDTGYFDPGLCIPVWCGCGVAYVNATGDPVTVSDECIRTGDLELHEALPSCALAYTVCLLVSPWAAPIPYWFVPSKGWIDATGAAYTSSVTYLDPGLGSYGKPIWRVTGGWVTATGAVVAPSGSQYPTISLFDSGLGKPVWLGVGTDYIDGAGNSVDVTDVPVMTVDLGVRTTTPSQGLLYSTLLLNTPGAMPLPIWLASTGWVSATGDSATGAGITSAYFDPNLGDYGLPIWLTDGSWVNATGTVVTPSGLQYPEPGVFDLGLNTPLWRGVGTRFINATGFPTPSSDNLLRVRDLGTFDLPPLYAERGAVITLLGSGQPTPLWLTAVGWVNATGELTAGGGTGPSITLGTARTLFVPYPVAGPFFGAEATALVWPPKSSEGVLAYGASVSDLVSPGDALLWVDASVTPCSRPCDLRAGPVSVFGNSVFGVVLASGIPGNNYRVRLRYMTRAGVSDTLVALIFVNADSPAVPPPCDLNALQPGSVPMTVMMNLPASGSSIVDAFPITAQTSGFLYIPSGSGCVLPANPGTPIVVINQALNGNVLLVYPPNDGQSNINGLAVGAPVEIAAPAVPGTTMESTFVYGQGSQSHQIEAY